MASPAKDLVAALRADLARLSGPVRTRKLLELARALGDRYWRTGVGSAAGLPDLNEAIEASQEAYGYLRDGDPYRHIVGNQLGTLLGLRHLVHGPGPAADRDTAIDLLAGALPAAQLPPLVTTVGGTVLGQLYLNRAMPVMLSAGTNLAALRSAISPQSRADAQAAVDWFHKVLASETDARVSKIARFGLTVAEVTRDMFEAFGGGGLDLVRMSQAFASLQGLTNDLGGMDLTGLAGGNAAGLTLGDLVMNPDLIAGMDPLDRPVTVMQDPGPVAPAASTARRPAAPEPDREALRSTLLERLTGSLPGTPGDRPPETVAAARTVATAVLRPDVPPPPGDAVDEAVATATELVHSGDSDPAAAAVDRFLLAVALFLRARLDQEPEDHRAAAESLLAAAWNLPPDHPVATAALLGLGAFLDDPRPLRGVLDHTGDGFAERAEAVLAAGAADRSDLAVIRALRGVCLAAAAARSGRFADATGLAESVAGVPATYPWRFRLLAAAGVAVLGHGLAVPDRAMVAGGIDLLRAAVVAAPAHQYTGHWPAAEFGALAAALGAFAGGDAGAARKAAQRLAEVVDFAKPGEGASRLHAVLGALRLWLADRPGGSVTDVSAAIEALTAATERLADDPDAVLRNESRWRLADAYRRRGTPADLRQAWLVATQARAGAGRSGAAPLRFAGWMLSENRAAEAFEALEAAAVAGAGEPPADPLVHDIAAVLLGSDPVPTAGGRPHSVADVAAALRAVGADAMLWLHPDGEPDGEPDEGLVRGVLLDPVTGQVTLVGPAPVAGPAWGEAAWPALIEPVLRLGAGSGPRRAVVAATGRLGRAVALAAVRGPAGRYAAAELTVSQVASGHQLVELAGRAPLPIAGSAVVVANPCGDREPATVEAIALRRLFYPHSTGLGRTVERVHGAGTPAEVLAHLPDAAIIHFGCAVRPDGVPALELADPADPARPAWLDADQIRAQARRQPAAGRGGVAVLPADSGAVPGQWTGLADALLDAGLTGMVGWLWPVPAPVAALMLFVLHARLVEDGLSPADAVGAVHRWMLDPRRETPPNLPAGYREPLAGTDLTDPSLWAALCYRGR